MLAACNNGGGNTDGDTGVNPDAASVLVRTDDAGDACPNGGFIFSYGPDANGDGALGDDEIAGSQTVCNGAQGETGSDGEPGPSWPSVPHTPPTGPSSSTLTSNGGSSTQGSGGDAGYIEFDMDYGNPGGHAAVFRTGTVDASFTAPNPTVNLGPRPAQVTANATMFLLATDDPAAAGLAAGALYRVGPTSTVYRWDGTSSDVATGLRVAAGATLTVRTSGSSGATLNFAGGVQIDGALTTEPNPVADVAVTPPTTAGLTINAHLIVVGPSGRIDLSGADGSGADDGGEGGSLDVDTDDGEIRIGGTLHFDGGAATCTSGCTAGRGGELEIYAQGGDLLANAIVDLSGGDATGGFGGRGGVIQFGTYAGSPCSGGEGATGSVLLAGQIDLSGGDGAEGGGRGGGLDLYASIEGPQSAQRIAMLGFPTLNLDGGDGTTSGGEGGYAEV